MRRGLQAVLGSVASSPLLPLPCSPLSSSLAWALQRAVCFVAGEFTSTSRLVKAGSGSVNVSVWGTPDRWAGPHRVELCTATQHLLGYMPTTSGQPPCCPSRAMLRSARLPLPQAPTWCRVKNPQYTTNTHMLVGLPDLKRTPRLRPTPTHCRVANLQYAADTAAAILPAYEAALGVPYPLEKLDLVAIPDFSAGAMENWGEALGCLVRSLLWCVIVAAYFSSKSSRVWCGGRGFVPLLRHALEKLS